MATTLTTIRPTFDVEEGKMEEFLAIWHTAIEPVKAEVGCYFYGFQRDGNTVFCRESYNGAAAALEHLRVVDSQLKQALQISKLAKLEVHGDAADIEALREPLKALPVDFFVADPQIRDYREKFAQGNAKDDTACAILPYFKVHDGKLEEFKALWKGAVPSLSSEGGLLFYDFTFNGNIAACREEYKDAAAVQHHLANVDAALKTALGIASLESLAVHGPAEEMDKLREGLAPLGCKFLTFVEGFRNTIE